MWLEVNKWRQLCNRISPTMTHSTDESQNVVVTLVKHVQQTKRFMATEKANEWLPRVERGWTPGNTQDLWAGWGRPYPVSWHLSRAWSCLLGISTSFQLNYPSITLRKRKKSGGKQEGIYSSYFIYFYTVLRFDSEHLHLYNKNTSLGGMRSGRRAVSISGWSFEVVLEAVRDNGDNDSWVGGKGRDLSL